MSAPFKRQATLLVVTGDDIFGRMLDTLFGPAGYRTVRVSTVDEAVRHARAYGPDLVVLHSDLLRADAVVTCARLRDLPEVGRRTPLVAVATLPLSPAERRNTLRAGVWHLAETPFNPEDLILQLNVFVEAKREADSYRDSAEWDPLTGLYTSVGVRQRAVELAARAARTKEPLACVVFSLAGATVRPEMVLDELVRALRAMGRRSDVIGKMGREQFAVLAPATPAEGAMRLAERLTSGMDPGARAQLRGGLDVAGRIDVDKADRIAPQLIEHASAAAADATEGNNGWLKRWDNGH